MKLILADWAKECLNDIFDYNSKYSFKNAQETQNNLLLHLNRIEKFPYIRQRY